MRVTLAVLLWASIVVLSASPARASNPTEEPTAEVQTLYELGMTRFESGEYEQALIHWKRAFVLLPHTESTLRPALVDGIVAAHMRAHDVTRNPEHLAEAMRVIDLRKAEIARFHQAAPGEADKLDAQRAELARLHELALSQGEQATELPEGTALQIVAPPPPAQLETAIADPPPPAPSPEKQLEAAIAADHELGREFRRAKSMTDAGFILMMIGVGAVPLAAMLTVQAYNPKDGAAPVLGYLIPAPIIVAVPLIVGGTLYGIGKPRKHRIMAEYRARPEHERTPVPTPLVLPHGGGLGFAGRF
jgi:hypothetical protein